MVKTLNSDDLLEAGFALHFHQKMALWVKTQLRISENWGASESPEDF